MRKYLIAVLALCGVITAAGVAWAANQYVVDIAGSSPKGKGTAKRPLPQKLRFGYEVSDSEGLRPQVVRQYRIAAEGLVTFPKSFRACKFTELNRQTVPSKCAKARVGGGTVTNNAGPAADRTAKLPCQLRLTLYNISDAGRRGGLAIRLDGDPPACPIPVHTAIKAPYTNVKINGIRSSELRFSVPENLAHPAGLDNAVIDTTSTVERKLGKATVGGVRRTVGFYSEIGCKGRRTVRVEFVDETNTKFTANKPVAC